MRFQIIILLVSLIYFRSTPSEASSNEISNINENNLRLDNITIIIRDNQTNFLLGGIYILVTRIADNKYIGHGITEPGQGRIRIENCFPLNEESWHVTAFSAEYTAIRKNPADGEIKPSSAMISRAIIDVGGTNTKTRTIELRMTKIQATTESLIPPKTLIEQKTPPDNIALYIYNKETRYGIDNAEIELLVNDIPREEKYTTSHGWLLLPSIPFINKKIEYIISAQEYYEMKGSFSLSDEKNFEYVPLLPKTSIEDTTKIIDKSVKPSLLFLVRDVDGVPLEGASVSVGLADSIITTFQKNYTINKGYITYNIPSNWYNKFIQYGNIRKKGYIATDFNKIFIKEIDGPMMIPVIMEKTFLHRILQSPQNNIAKFILPAIGITNLLIFRNQMDKTYEKYKNLSSGSQDFEDTWSDYDMYENAYKASIGLTAISFGWLTLSYIYP